MYGRILRPSTQFLNMGDLLRTQAHLQNSQNQLTYVPPTSRSHRLGWRLSALAMRSLAMRSLATTSDSALNNARLLSVCNCSV